MESNRGPSAYQPNALPLGQTDSLGNRKPVFVLLYLQVFGRVRGVNVAQNYVWMFGRVRGVIAAHMYGCLVEYVLTLHKCMYGCLIEYVVTLRIYMDVW